MIQQNAPQWSIGNMFDSGEIWKEKKFLWGKLLGLQVQKRVPTSQWSSLEQPLGSPCCSFPWIVLFEKQNLKSFLLDL